MVCRGIGYVIAGALALYDDIGKGRGNKRGGFLRDIVRLFRAES